MAGETRYANARAKRAFVVQSPLRRADYRAVIRLHRLGHRDEVFHLNPDLILSIEATPDTVVTLTTHSKVIVHEGAEEVVAAVRQWRAGILEQAFPRIRRRSDVPLAIVGGTNGVVRPPHEEDRR